MCCARSKVSECIMTPDLYCGRAACCSWMCKQWPPAAWLLRFPASTSNPYKLSEFKLRCMSILSHCLTFCRAACCSWSTGSSRWLHGCLRALLTLGLSCTGKYLLQWVTPTWQCEITLRYYLTSCRAAQQAEALRCLAGHGSTLHHSEALAHLLLCRGARRSWRRKRRYACLVADDRQLGVVGSCSIALNSPEAVSSKTAVQGE